MSIKPANDVGVGSRPRFVLFFLRRHTDWFVLAVGLVLTVGATLYLGSSVNKAAERKFRAYSDNIHKLISHRLDDHVRILQSGAALFNASDGVTREEWRIFTQTQKIDTQLPGIQGFGLSLLIPSAELPRHIQEIRRKGFPAYTLKPDGDRKWYSSIIFLEPFSDRNLLAFGYDMLSEPIRRVAMEQARDTGVAALSGKVVLLQETTRDVQAGTLMYFPVYRKGMPTATTEQRRAAIYGWVYSPYRMNDLMQGILGNSNLEQDTHIHLQLFDGVQPSPQNLLFERKHPDGHHLWDAVRFTRQIPIDFNGQRWTLFLKQGGKWYLTGEYTHVWFTLASGTIISLLLFTLFRNLTGTRAEARRMAEEMTLELRSERQRLANILDGTRAGTWEWNIQTGEALFNEQWAAIIGYSLDEIAPARIETWMRYAHRDDLARSGALLDSYFRGESDYYECESRMKHKDGHWVWVLDRGKIASWSDDGRPLWMFGTHQEITGRKLMEENLWNERAFLRNLIDSAEDLVYFKDQNGLYLCCNKASERFIGISEREQIGKSDFDLIEHELAELVVRHDKEVMESGRSHRSEVWIALRNGDKVLLDTVKTPIYGSDNQLIGLVGISRDVTAKKEAELFLTQAKDTLEIEVLARTAELKHAYEELHKISFKLAWAEEKERERIAGELHDQVGQSLLLAKMKVDELADEVSADELRTSAEKAAELIRTSIQDIRSLTFKMRPLLLDSPDIETNLRWLCTSLNEDYNVSINFTGTDTTIPLAHKLRETLCRVVRELLLNVIKHAQTAHAVLSLQTDDRNLTLRVIDQGVGFSYFGAVNKHANVGGYGLLSVRQRIEWIGGTLAVESIPGRGTEVTVVVPLQQSHNEWGINI